MGERLEQLQPSDEAERRASFEQEAEALDIHSEDVPLGREELVGRQVDPCLLVSYESTVDLLEFRIGKSTLAVVVRDDVVRVEFLKMIIEEDWNEALVVPNLKLQLTIDSVADSFGHDRQACQEAVEIRREDVTDSPFVGRISVVQVVLDMNAKDDLAVLEMKAHHAQAADYLAVPGVFVVLHW